MSKRRFIQSNSTSRRRANFNLNLTADKPVMFTVGCIDESCIGFPAVKFQTRRDAIAAWEQGGVMTNGANIAGYNAEAHKRA
jgi:hypothetical protein